MRGYIASNSDQLFQRALSSGHPGDAAPLQETKLAREDTVFARLLRFGPQQKVKPTSPACALNPERVDILSANRALLNVVHDDEQRDKRQMNSSRLSPLINEQSCLSGCSIQVSR